MNMYAGLWQCVILQAIDDADSTAVVGKEKEDKDRAIAWLTGNSKDFRFVCELAGINANAIDTTVKAFQTKYGGKA